MQMTDIDWRLPLAEKLEEKEAEKHLQNVLHSKFESLVVASRVLQAVEKFKGLLHHREREAEEQLPLEEKKRRAGEAADSLARTSPFSFLPGAVRRQLAAKAHRLSFKEGDVLTRQKSRDRQIFVLQAGQVMALDMSETLPRFLNFYNAPAYFGEWECLFDVPERVAELVAGSDVVVYAWDQHDFLDLLSYQSFKYVLIRTLRNKQRLFAAINAFISHIADSITTKRIDFNSTLSLYRKLKPAIHSRMDSHEIDTGGWAYAIRRLPENVTQTFVFLFSSSIPDIYLHPDLLVNMVPTVGRRRAVFRLGDGKSLVLIREDYTDVIDFLSMLCLHAIEARKLRQRISSPRSFRLIQDFVLTKAKQIQQPHAQKQEISNPCSPQSSPGHSDEQKGSPSARRRESTKEEEQLGQGFPLPSVGSFDHQQKETPAEQDTILGQLSLSEKETAGLKALWPNDLIHRIWDIIVHHEDYNISVNLSTHYTSDATERWTHMVHAEVVRLIGPYDCPVAVKGERIQQHFSKYLENESYSCSERGVSSRKGKGGGGGSGSRGGHHQQQKEKEEEEEEQEEEVEVEVDIISSNTHSVINCLSPYLHRKRHEILEWAAREKPVPHIDRLDLNADDKFYVLSYYYFKAFPQLLLEREEEERKAGMFTVKETEFTGIQVNLIDLSRLDPQCVDSSLREYVRLRSQQVSSTGEQNAQSTTTAKRRLLVNIDYAFGRQAGDVLCCLILLFGHAIRSVNVLGKAGGLQGKRGDIMLATHLILQEDDSVTEIRNEGLSVQNLRSLAGGRDVWPGGVLTVPGTLLQDRNLLHFYKRLWNCVGLEMEGSYYAGQVNKYKKLAFLRDDLVLRFLYFVSDLPLHTDANLSQAMRVDEGLPPLYATTRAVLQQILH
jgi:CRP-like cAMP-binding protein